MIDKTKRSPTKLLGAAALALGAVAAAGTLVASVVGRVDEPRYTAELQDGDFEVRRYDARVVAETEIEGPWAEAGNEGFRRLAGYIFGKNDGREKIAMTAPVGERRGGRDGAKIAMTAPVGQRRTGDVWTVSFTMPQRETLATLPKPDDPRVVLRMLAATKVAVVRFSGRWTDANMDERRVALLAWAARRGLVVKGEAEVNRYDPPFKPWFLRRNEVWLEVDAATS